MTVAARFSGPGQPYEGLALRDPVRWTGDVRMVREHLEDPLRWRRPRRIFVNSMSDLFHESLSDEAIADVVAVMALAHWHTFQVLTKRTRRMAQFLATGLPLIVAALNRRGVAGQGMAARLQGDMSVADDWVIKQRWPLPNVEWGTSVEDQAALQSRGPDLLACRDHAAVLWMSLEPLLGPVTMDVGYRNFLVAHRCLKCQSEGRDSIRPDSEYSRSKWGAWYSCGTCGGCLYQAVQGIDLVVIGGESGGASSRPMNPLWPRMLLAEVLKSRGLGFSTAYHFKQWGDWAPATEGISVADWLSKEVRQLDDGQLMIRVGKKAAGAVLDGRTWAELPITEKAG